MQYVVDQNGWLTLAGRQVRAALGRAGVVPEHEKREGDGATPLGQYRFRHCLFRPDRIDQPISKLPVRPIRPDDGWCDAPDDAGYNRLVRLPYAHSCETLTREDGLYDMILVLGHNDDPPTPGLGSAIFMHCRRGDYEPTEGCVALAPADLRTLLECIKPGDTLVIR
jgi:L,D-peptidoglycan transpeptidase YkuD (ErfK/YbiS/YcfS/YnhG family)